MDLIRDPRYGRAEESYGEDTYLCAEFARETVLGMQGTDLTAPDAVAAEPKHYVGYGNPVGTELRPLHHGTARCIQRLPACL